MNNNEQDNKILEEEMKKHRKTTIILRIVGICLIVVGAALDIIGTILLMNFNESAMILIFIGAPALFTGIFLTTISFRKNMMRYTMNQTKELNKDYINYMLGGTKENIVGATKEMMGKEVVCSNCGTHNDSDATFCKKCGTPLKKVCPNCNTVNDNDAEYCDNCGKKFD